MRYFHYVWQQFFLRPSSPISLFKCKMFVGKEKNFFFKAFTRFYAVPKCVHSKTQQVYECVLLFLWGRVPSITIYYLIQATFGHSKTGNKIKKKRTRMNWNKKRIQLNLKRVEISCWPNAHISFRCNFIGWSHFIPLCHSAKQEINQKRNSHRGNLVCCASERATQRAMETERVR